jgi:hypothetical protein
MMTSKVILLNQQKEVEKAFIERHAKIVTHPIKPLASS